MLCTLELNGLVDAIKGLGWKPGDRYNVVSVSFDPRETPTLASGKLALRHRPLRAVIDQRRINDRQVRICDHPVGVLAAVTGFRENSGEIAQGHDRETLA